MSRFSKNCVVKTTASTEVTVIKSGSEIAIKFKELP